MPGSNPPARRIPPDRWSTNPARSFDNQQPIYVGRYRRIAFMPSKQTKKSRPARRRPPLGQRLGNHPLTVYRPGRVAEIFGVNESTIWRWWAKLKILPPPREFSPGIHGWSGQELSDFQERAPRLESEASDA
jgi:predicted DNA-binding transcriptional regulator AlpA